MASTKLRTPGVWLALVALTIVFPACDPLLDPDAEPVDRLLFVSQRDGATNEAGTLLWEIYSVRLDGTAAQNLTRSPAPAYNHLRLSPDGSRVVFYSDRSGCFNIWTMGTDGSDLVQLTGHDPGDRCNVFPEWSPDGSKIMFTSSRNPLEQGWDTYVMNPDGSGVVNVSNNAGSAGVRSDYGHGWTADGRVVFHDLAQGEPVRTYVVDPDGSSLELLLEPGDRQPYWSPDGSRIAFLSDRDGSTDIFVMNAGGTGVTKVGGSPHQDYFWPWGSEDPWSPDGSRLAFTSDRDGSAEIYVVAPDGTGVQRITDDPGGDRFHGWSPDGSRIVFTSGRTGNSDVFVVNADGSGLHQVTHDTAPDARPVWLVRH